MSANDNAVADHVRSVNEANAKVARRADDLMSWFDRHPDVLDEHEDPHFIALVRALNEALIELMRVERTTAGVTVEDVTALTLALGSARQALRLIQDGPADDEVAFSGNKALSWAQGVAMSAEASIREVLDGNG